ncbi:MAG: homoserine O-acetyltransferase MetX [Dermatophilaceae bacterium]
MTVTDDPSVIHGAWREGQHPGNRLFADVGAVALERGGRLPAVRVAYETWGRLNARRDNAVLIEHALTGDSHVEGQVGPGHVSTGWWPGLIGTGRALDPDEHFVVAANVLGGCQGSTGPSSTSPDGQPWGSRFPFVTIRDQVEVEVRLAEYLGIPRWELVMGGSMGGMRSLEWAVSYPERVARAMVIGSTAASSGDQIAWSLPQLLAIRSDPSFLGGDYYRSGRAPDEGMGIARRIAHITYRSAAELDVRFGRAPQPGEQPLGGQGRYAVESYLDHQAERLRGRFDANSYIVLTEAMNSHDIGRGRGGVAAALARVSADVVAVAVDSDRLYLRWESEQIADGVRHGRLAMIHSPHGHDGFLTEVSQVGSIVGDLLR